MRKSMEKTEEVKKEEVKSKLVEAFVLWKNKSKSGNDYLKGHAFNNDPVIAYFNTNKKNPKEPDVRVYSLDAEGKQDKEIASLWATVGKNEKPYLTGKDDEDAKLIAFYDNQEKHPYIKAYFKED